MASKRDYFLVLIVGFLFGLFSIPVLENIKPVFWELSFINTAKLLIGFSFFALFALFLGSVIGKRFFWVWQFSKFGAVGSLGAALDFGILNLLSLATKIYSGPYIILFNSISVLVAIVNVYLWNKYWVFQSGGAIGAGELSKFIAVYAIGFSTNVAIVYFITTFARIPSGISPAIWENIAKLTAVGIVLIWNFIGLKFFVFKGGR